MLEVETKFSLENRKELVERLDRCGAIPGQIEQHADTYFRHPCRNFVETKEALRIRSIGGVAYVTYKGPKYAVGDSALKARKELEWCLEPGDADGSQMDALLTALGFSKVTTVRKTRQPYAWPEQDAEHTGFAITIDQVDQVGLFAEIELLVPEDLKDGVDLAGDRINALAERLGLHHSVRESYLSLLLKKIGE